MPYTNLGALHRLPDLDRRAIARRHIGTVVVVTYDGLRDATSAKTLEGRLLAVARPLTGSASSMLIVGPDVRPGRDDDSVAISTATVVGLSVKA